MRSARPFRPSPPAVAAAVLLVAATALAGCGALFRRRYDNFRAYYNTYYNAERKLEEGETALLNVNTPVDRTRLVTLFPTSPTTAGRTPVFDAAIDKSAELLRRRPGSRWADDALLVIGKAYFYERNFVGAEQKFRETMAAAEIVQDRRLADEARFWLGRTMAAADRYDEGVLVLREALDRPDVDRYWQARMHLALGELYARAGRWDAATVDLRDGLATIGDADLAARSSLLLGQVEEAAGRYDAAADAYRDALGRRPAYEIAFAAELNRGLVLGLDAGQPEAGLDLLRAMGRDDKNYARRADVALAQARVLAASGQPDAARTRFREVLYDDALAGQSVRGEAHYRFAEFYRDALGDYVTAAMHFDSASTSLTSPPTAAQRPSRAAIVGAGLVATTYQTVARTSQRIAAVDSLLALGALDDDAFRTRIAEIESVRLAAWVQQRREAEAQRTAQDFGGAGPVTVPFGGDPDGATADGRGVSTVGIGGDEGAAAASSVENGFLGYRDPRTVQSGLLSFQRIFGDRPLVPNWRRRAAVQGGTVASGVGGGDGTEDFAPGFNTGLAGPPLLDLTGIPRTPEAQAVLITERAALRYELANTFFLALDRTDRAEVLYRLILDETPDAPVAPRARYALAELTAEAGRAADAEPLYRGVAEADSLSQLGQAARARLDGRDPVAALPVTDAGDDDAYTAARRLWDDGDPRRAATALVALGSADPDAPGAPRAFFAAALAYADWASAAPDTLQAPLPPDLVPPALAEIAEAAAPPPDAPDDTAVADAFPEDQPVVPRGARRDRTRPGLPPSIPASTPVPVGAPDGIPGSPTADSTVTVPAEGDEAVGVADSTVVADSSVIADLTVIADSTVTADSLFTEPVGLEDAGPAGLTLRGYLVAFAARYSETPYAERAQALAAVLPDSSGTVAPATFDSAVGFGGLTGAAPIDLLLGGVSWRSPPFPTLDDARARLLELPTSDVRTAFATDDMVVFYLIGHFADADAAADAALTAPPGLLDEATVEPVGDLLIVDTAPAVLPAAPPAGSPSVRADDQ